MGGLAANDGAAKYWLNGLAAFFCVLTIVWIAAPSVGPVAEIVRPFAIAVQRSGALVILVGVAFALLTVKGKTGSGGTASKGVMLNPVPKFAAPPDEISKWTADIKLSDAAKYIFTQSRWRQDQRYNVQVEKVKTELLAALRKGKITAWGKAHPEDELRSQVARDLWYGGDLTVDTNYAFFEMIGVSGHNIMLSNGQLEAAYPPLSKK